MLTDVDILTEIDIDLDIPCEDSWHGMRVPGLDEPATIRIRWNCTKCSLSITRNICEPDYHSLKGFLKCKKCQGFVVGRDCMTVVSKL